MEQDNKKRVREGDHDHRDQNQKDHSKRLANSKQQQDHGLFDIVDDFQDDQYKTLGVFDFPWLKDGVVSKSEDGWKLEDVFSSPLDETSTVTATIAGIEFSFSGQCLCQATPETLLDLPEDKFEETESVENCIWSSLLNQPLQQPN